MKKIIFLILFFISLFAEIKTVSVIAQGYGMTQDEAVKNALINAISQVKGIAITAKKTLKKRIQESHISIDNLNIASTKVVDATSSKIQSATGGFVKSYRIFYVKKISPDEYKAKLKVYFTSYKSPGLNPKNRRSLAVIPFEYKKTYNIYGRDINGRVLSERITQAIINKITQTRKFTILDRQNSKYYEFEKNFLLSSDTEVSELARLGKRLGADYFIIGKILDFGINKEVSSNYYTSEVNSKNIAYATISYRILNIPTQQIKWSDTIDIEFILPVSKRVESIISKASNKIAQILTEQIIFNIYPPRIIEISNNKAIINMGGNVLHKGDIFKVYALGKKLYDPYTKEYLGRDENEIGEVEITIVKPKISYAKVISGTIKKGAILRKFQENKNSSSSQDSGKESMFEMLFSKPH